MDNTTNGPIPVEDVYAQDWLDTQSTSFEVLRRYDAAYLNGDVNRFVLAAFKAGWAKAQEYAATEITVDQPEPVRISTRAVLTRPQITRIVDAVRSIISGEAEGSVDQPETAEPAPAYDWRHVELLFRAFELTNSPQVRAKLLEELGVSEPEQKTELKAESADESADGPEDDGCISAGVLRAFLDNRRTLWDGGMAVLDELDTIRDSFNL